jgi:hypothetical protein
MAAVVVALVFAVTGVIELLKPHVPVLRLGVLYIFVVLVAAIVWGGEPRLADATDGDPHLCPRTLGLSLPRWNAEKIRIVAVFAYSCGF